MLVTFILGHKSFFLCHYSSMWSVFKVFYTDSFIVGEGGTVDRSLVLLDAVSLTLSTVKIFIFLPNKKNGQK